MENAIWKYKKLFQYFMILVIFAAAVFLPPYAAKWQAAKAVGETISGEYQAQEDGENSEAGIAENAQTIVIDPGHGGCQLRRGAVSLKSGVPGIGKQML